MADKIEELKIAYEKAAMALSSIPTAAQNQK